jgi:putative membrane protein
VIAGLPWRHWAMLAVFTAVLAWSAWHPKDTFTWVLEVLPALIGIAIVAATYTRFRLSDLAYLAILLHSLILMVGGHYTYAEVPLFNWLRDDHLGLVRNDYDRVGHFAQGFFPAIIAREILLRRSPLVRGKWLFFIVTCICLAISATYELIEWRVAVSTGDESVAFLATQGDPWDTQWDMLTALIGALASLILLSRFHDKSMAKRKRA